MKPAALIQARVGSQRLPGKVLADIGGCTMLERVVGRCGASRALAEIAIVTSDLVADEPIADLAARMRLRVFRGSENDVLDRYVRAAETWGLPTIVRITADCPLLDSSIIDDVIARQEESEADYAYVDGYPNGVGAAEVVKVAALNRSRSESSPQDTYYREHVVSYILDHPESFHLDISTAPESLRRPDIRLSVDALSDLELVRFVYECFRPRAHFTTAEVLDLLDRHPVQARMNAHERQKER
jgi:spore coat polysaccharide biosynthesis protein SpsF (cytidylyltransferase family)